MGGTWTALGPQPIHNLATFGDVSGRVTAIAVNPSNGNIVYAGTAGGGIWKTTDGGSHWTGLTDSQASLSIGAIALDPSNPSIIYAGTGEANGCADCQYTRGVLKSSDGGTSWQLMDAADFDGSYLQFSSIVVDKLNSQHILAGTTAGLLYSTNGGSSWSLSGNLKALSSSLYQEVSTVFEDPSNPQIFFAAVGEGCAGYGYITRSNDSGYTWPANYTIKLSVFAPAPFGYPKISRVGLGEGPGGVLYASLAACSSTTPAYSLGQLVAVIKSTDAGLHWTHALSGRAPGLSDFFQGGPGFYQGDYDNVVAVDPTNANRAVFGGVTMLATSDGGATFTDVAKPYNNGPVHPDVHAVAFIGAQSFYTGNDGGVWKTSDLGGTGQKTDWNNLNATLAVSTFYAGTALDSTHMIGGTQDDDIVGLLPGGPTPPAWNPMLDGDGSWTAMVPSSTVVYGELPLGDIWKGDSTNANAWQPAGPCPSPYTAPACSDQTGFVAPFVMDATNPSYLYAATNHVYRTTTGGLPAGSAGWTQISPDLTTASSVLSGGDFITAMAMDGHDTIVTGSYGGRIMLTTNASSASPTWENVTGFGIPAFSSSDYSGNPWITSLAVRGISVWATIGRVGGTAFHLMYVPLAAHNWQTLDGDPSQGSMSGGGVPLWIAVDPADADTLFLGRDSGGLAGSDGGVFVCGNCGGAVESPFTFWARVGAGMPNARVDAVTLANDGGSLVAWTHGRGAWSIVRKTKLSASPSPLDFGPQTVGDPPAQLSLTIQNLGLKDSSGLTTSISGPNAADFSVAAGTQPYLLSCVGGTVGALNKCTFLVSFKPSAEVTETATLTITDAQGASTTVTLTGKGGHPAVSFNPAAISFGSVGYRTDNVLYATATNTGTGPLQFKSATVTGSTDFSVAGGCLGGMRIAPGGTCQLFVEFLPRSVGDEAATLSVSDNTAGSPDLIQASGTSVQSSVTVTPSKLAFGDVLVGTSQSKGVTIQDSAAYPYVSDLPTGVGAPYSANDNCSSQIAAGSRCGISVTFAPTTMGEVDQTMTFTDNSTTSPHQIQITGRGVAPSASYSAAGLTFTNQRIGTISAAQTITITNQGTAPLHVGTIAIDTGPSADFTATDGCTGAVAANGGTCTIGVTFHSPTPGRFDAHLNVFSDSFTGANPEVLILSGTAVGPEVSLDNTSLHFGVEGPGQTSLGQTITVKNTGNADLVISAVGSPTDFPQTNTCTSAAVPADQTCTITVKFAPTAAGQRNVLLTITDNGISGQEQVFMSGTGFGASVFQRLSANMSSAPSVASSGPSRLDVVARGQDMALYYQYSTDGGLNWNGWNRIPANMTSAPAVTSSQPGRVDVVARGSDNALYYTYTIDNGAHWVYWQRIAANTTSAPAVTSSAAGRIDLVVRGTDNALYYTYTTDGGAHWVYWQRIAATVTADPSITSWGGRLDAFVRGTDNALYHTWSTDGGKTWAYWQRISANMAAGPASATWGQGRLDVFAVGRDSNTYHTWSTDGATTWHYWELVGGFPLSSNAAAVSRSAYHVDLFGRGPDKALDYDYLNPF